MKIGHKFIHISLIVAILMATTGFRVNVSYCQDTMEPSMAMSADGGCCCSKKESKVPQKPCNEVTCFMQRGVASQSSFNASTQQVARILEPVSYPSFTEAIRPVLLEKIPHVTLPPPLSGRDIGILHQTFRI